MMIVKSGKQFVHELENGEGMLYEIVEDLVCPVKLVRTLSSEEVLKVKEKPS